MRLKRSNIFSLVVVIIMAAICSHSCTPSDLDFTISPGKERQDESATRLPISKYQNVFLVYSMGYNDIYSYLKDDIKDLVSSPLMQNRRDIMLIFSHLANKYPGERYPSFNEPTCPTLTKVYRNIEGDIVKDTLLVLPETEIAADPQTMKKILAAGGDTYYAFKTAAANYDLGIPMDEVLMDYITTVLGGNVSAAQYGAPRGSIVIY